MAFCFSGVVQFLFSVHAARAAAFGFGLSAVGAVVAGQASVGEGGWRSGFCPGSGAAARHQYLGLRLCLFPATPAPNIAFKIAGCAGSDHRRYATAARLIQR